MGDGGGNGGDGGGDGSGDGGGGLGDGGEGEGEGSELNPDAIGVTAVALTPCSTQEATSNWSIVPLTLKNE